MITIIDYKMSNLGSILNMLKKAGSHDNCIATEPRHILEATKIIMPGIGSFDAAILKLQEMKLIEPLRQKAMEEKIPFLGICLGMQLMLEGSEEGTLPGLGFVKGRVKKFEFDQSSKLRSPHMGWNTVIAQKESKILSGEKPPRFYFVHSYYVQCDDPSDVLTLTDHGQNFVSAFEHQNLIGVQFHPEKSHNFGMDLFKNFVEKY